MDKETINNGTQNIRETCETIKEMQEVIMNDVKKNTEALFFAFKYAPPEVMDDDFLDDIVKAKRFAIQIIPEKRISDTMIWTIIEHKNPRPLFSIPNHRITKEMEDVIIDTFTTPGLQKYLLYMSDIIEKETVIRIIQKIRKYLRVYTRKYISDRFKRDEEILELLGYNKKEGDK